MLGAAPSKITAGPALGENMLQAALSEKLCLGASSQKNSWERR